MQKLTKKEEQIMQVLWNLEKAFVKEIIAELPEPKPHYNTVATIIRILKDKGFIDYHSFGNTYQYYPVVKKNDYQQQTVNEVISNYFDNSYVKMVTYFAKKDKISQSELEDILEMIKKQN